MSDDLPPFWLSAASGGAMLYLLFHAWFALKSLLLLAGVLGSDRLFGLGDDRLVGALAVLTVPLLAELSRRIASSAEFG
jgi:hypothetical protein